MEPSAAAHHSLRGLCVWINTGPSFRTTASATTYVYKLYKLNLNSQSHSPPLSPVSCQPASCQLSQRVSWQLSVRSPRSVQRVMCVVCGRVCVSLIQ